MPDALAPTPELRLDGFAGTVLRPGDAAYDDARAVFNGMIDRRPALIAACAGPQDVVAAVGLARERGVPVSVYGGGHSVSGTAVCDDGVTIDLRATKGIEVDPKARTCRAEAGLTWGEFDAATQEHGLAVTGGRMSGTGIAGLTVGSGSGWLERKLGYTCDNLIACEVVTADGRRVVASEKENPDLFWGLRGGGGNFGVVTAFHFRLHRVGPIVLGGMLVYPREAGAELLGAYRAFCEAAPDELGTAMAFITAPPEEFVPEPVRGHPVIGIITMYAGPVEQGEALLAPLRERAALDMLGPMPYLAVQQLIDAGNPKGMRNYWKADTLADLPDEAIEEILQHTAQPPSPMTQTILYPSGGTAARVPDEATALGHRTAPWNLHHLGMWPDPADDERNIEATRAFSAAMGEWSTGRAYLNYIGETSPHDVEAALGPEKFARLVEVKRSWDPGNLFRFNQNIPPDGA